MLSGARGAPEDLPAGRRADSELVSAIYSELRRIARAHLRRERRGNSVQTTLLVNEAYLRLRGREWLLDKDRSQFLALASGAMRRILVDLARRRGAAKRGGDVARIVIDDRQAVPGVPLERVLDVDRALSKLESLDKRQSAIVEMRFFGGLSEEEIGGVLGISVRTVKREWSTAKAWLYSELL